MNGKCVLLLMLLTALSHAADPLAACKEGTTYSIVCLETKLKQANVKLRSVSKLVAQQMRELDAATLRNEAVQAFTASEHAFRLFRARNCQWQATAAAGGIAGSKKRLVCELTLTHARLAELRAQLGH